MTDEVINFEWYMKVGNEDLGIGRFADAVIAFAYAADKAPDAYKSACAYQMQGVALRLNKDYPEAHVAFGFAAMFALGNDELRLRIERDEALVYMKEGNLRLASTLLEDSYSGLRKLGSYTEAAASLGFLARVELYKGERREAYRLLAEADRILRAIGTDGNYELNNLVWLFKLVSPFERLALLPHVLQLIRQTDQRRRLVEVALLVTGGNWLYNKAEQRYANRPTRRSRS